jgi:hypothetical protein
VTAERSPDPESVRQLLKRAAQLARDYYAETGRPLGVTGEVAEFEAARRLGLELTPARHGYDAERQLNGKRQRIEIKSRRAAPAESGKRPKPLGSQKLGAIKLDRQWQVVVLVLLDEQYRATEDLRGRPQQHPAATCTECVQSPRARCALGVRVQEDRWATGLGARDVVDLLRRGAASVL